MGPQRMYGMTPWVRRLLVANLLVFLLQKTVFLHLAAELGFAPLQALTHPWTLVTYMFLHGGVAHLAFNLLALYVFGPPVEERLGGRAFIGYYLLCGSGGAGDWRLSQAERRLRGGAAGGRTAEPGVLVHPAAREARGSDAGAKPRAANRDRVQAEIDRVLDKISARGMGSLTPAERKFLAEMSRKMRDRR